MVLPTMPAHDLHNECPLVGVCSTDNGVNGLNYAVEGRVCTNCHVSTAEIIVNRAHLQGIHFISKLAINIFYCRIV